jgi:hypothetical protein
MDEEVQKVFDRIEEDVSSRRTPEECAAAETPFLIPKETPVGVRYVRSRPRRHAFRGYPGNFCIGVLVLLSAAAVMSSLLLVTEGAALAHWQIVLGFLYPLQLVLDVVAFARLTWPFLKRQLGDLEVDLSASRLRAGIRFGPWWLDAESMRLGHLKRLVVVKRQEGKSDAIWQLAAEDIHGSLTTLISADDAGNVIPLAKDLHARLARREELRDCWPALAEEHRPGESETARPPRRPLLAGGAWTWLAVHVAGAAGLWQVGTLPWFKAPRPIEHTCVLVGLAFLQGLILVTNIGFLGTNPREHSS